MTARLRTPIQPSRSCYGATNTGPVDSTMIAITTDHGEAFGEHGENHHGISLR
jgi:hypothetical protein